MSEDENDLIVKYDQVSESGKRYYVGEYKNNPVRFYESGAIMHAETKKLLSRMDAEQSAKLNIKRWSDAREQARQALREKFSVNSSPAAVGKMVKILADDIKSNDTRPADKIKAVEFVMKAAGLTPDTNNQIKLTNKDGASVEGGISEVGGLLDWLNAQASAPKQSNIIEHEDLKD